MILEVPKYLAMFRRLAEDLPPYEADDALWLVGAVFVVVLVLPLPLLVKVIAFWNEEKVSHRKI